MNVMHTPEQLTTLLREHGHRVTAQRQCIFRILEGNTSHPSAEEVYQAARATMSTISLKTVYQILNELAEMGEISLLDLGTGTARFDPNVETAHHHLVCRSCGMVRDLNMHIGLPDVPEGADQGFLIEEAQVVFRGLCSSCASGRTEMSERGAHRRKSINLLGSPSRPLSRDYFSDRSVEDSRFVHGHAGEVEVEGDS
jgi:Fe2+ or Zn2+ uptake regulation protein